MYLVDHGHPQAAEALLGVLCLCAAAAAFALPYETAGRDLQAALGGEGALPPEEWGSDAKIRVGGEEEKGDSDGYASPGRGGRSRGEAELVSPGDRAPLLLPPPAAGSAQDRHWQ